MEKIDRLSEFTLNGLRLKNRVIVPAMASGTSDQSGCVTPQTLAHYAYLTTSAASMVIVEYAYVHQSGRRELQQLGVDSDDKIAGLKTLSQLIKISGAISGIQLSHAGAKTHSKITGYHVFGASAVPVPAGRESFACPEEMPIKDIPLFQDAFVQAALRAERAGFDLVELHCVHGSGLNQWLSPITNQRADNYGGSREARSKMLLEIVSGIRRQVPNLTLSVRLPYSDGMDDGLQLSDAKWLAQALEKAGAHVLNISSGLNGWRGSKEKFEQGLFLPEAEAIQKEVKIPVIAVGGIQEAEFVDKVIKEERIPLVAVGRSILESPLKWRESLNTDSYNC